MRLAIGDVVRVRESGALAVIDAVTTHRTGEHVLVQNFEGSHPRIVSPGGLEMVARRSRPGTTLTRTVTVVLFAVGCLAAYFTARAIQDLGGGNVLAFLACFGAMSAVLSPVNFLRRRTTQHSIRV